VATETTQFFQPSLQLVAVVEVLTAVPMVQTAVLVAVVAVVLHLLLRAELEQRIRVEMVELVALTAQVVAVALVR
jgi:hypothetical protein